MFPNSKLTRYLCAVIIGVQSIFVYLWIFIKTTVLIHFEAKRNGWMLSFDTIIDVAKMGLKLYKVHIKAIFEWVKDDDMERCRRNFIEYSKQIEP